METSSGLAVNHNGYDSDILYVFWLRALFSNKKSKLKLVWKYQVILGIRWINPRLGLLVITGMHFSMNSNLEIILHNFKIKS